MAKSNLPGTTWKAPRRSALCHIGVCVFGWLVCWVNNGAGVMRVCIWIGSRAAPRSETHWLRHRLEAKACVPALDEGLLEDGAVVEVEDVEGVQHHLHLYVYIYICVCERVDWGYVRRPIRH